MRLMVVVIGKDEDGRCRRCDDMMMAEQGSCHPTRCIIQAVAFQIQVEFKFAVYYWSNFCNLSKFSVVFCINLKEGAIFFMGFDPSKMQRACLFQKKVATLPVFKIAGVSRTRAQREAIRDPSHVCLGEKWLPWLRFCVLSLPPPIPLSTSGFYDQFFIGWFSHCAQWEIRSFEISSYH